MQAEKASREDLHAVHKTVERLARAAGAEDVETHVGCHIEALTRFANNTIHQNVAERGQYLSVRVQIGQKTARATTNRFDEASLENVVAQATALAKAVEPFPDLLPMAEPAALTPVSRFHKATSDATPDDRANAVSEAIRVVEAAGQTAAGIYSTGQEAGALFNSRGVAAYHSETISHFSITAMAGDSSGWAKASAGDIALISPVELARRAADKARLSGAPRELSPGTYTVILEPAAVLDLVGQIFSDFSATAIADQRSFLTDRIGRQLFGNNIIIHDDAYHPLQAGPNYDGEGVPRKQLILVDQGTPREIAWSRSMAHKAGVEPTGHGFPLPNETGEMPVNIVIEGGSTSLEELIASTARGILVTRLWYIREVEPYEKIMTGMTRDGTFLIEGGELVCGLKNFRFNQSVIELLNNVEAMSPAVRSSGEEAFDMVVPAMKVNNFHFTEVTRF
jgi:predicted Zn-dependent protease